MSEREAVCALIKEKAELVGGVEMTSCSVEKREIEIADKDNGAIWGFKSKEVVAEVAEVRKGGVGGSVG